MRSPYPYPPSWIGGFVVGGSPIQAPNDFPVAPGVQVTTPAYIYQEYLYDGYPPAPGDDDIQYFVAAYNEVAQIYVDWFANASLPVYGLQSDGLLDWVANGLYGFLRPLVPIGTATTIGPVDTFLVDGTSANGPLPVNSFVLVEPSTYYQTTDDLFQRIMTWHLYRGDGVQPNVKWLKRRVMRFLVGVNGTGGYPITSGIVMALDSFGNPVYWPTWYNIDQTYGVSLVFAGSTEATITISPGQFTLSSGPVNTFVVNTAVVNSDATTFVPSPYDFQYAYFFQAAVAAGAIELPGPYAWTVQIG